MAGQTLNMAFSQFFLQHVHALLTLYHGPYLRHSGAASGVDGVLQCGTHRLYHFLHLAGRLHGKYDILVRLLHRQLRQVLTVVADAFKVADRIE